MTSEGPEALLAELERARAQYARAELHARTYLAAQGVHEQAHTDVGVALKRLVRGVAARAQVSDGAA